MTTLRPLDCHGAFGIDCLQEVDDPTFAIEHDGDSLMPNEWKWCL